MAWNEPCGSVASSGQNPFKTVNSPLCTLIWIGIVLNPRKFCVHVPIHSETDLIVEDDFSKQNYAHLPMHNDVIYDRLPSDPESAEFYTFVVSAAPEPIHDCTW